MGGAHKKLLRKTHEKANAEITAAEAWATLTNAEFGAKVLHGKPDLMIPVFITDYLPHGVIGLLVVALIAAWMSSYSSTLNSLTAVTVEDFIAPRFNIPKEKYVRLSKLIALGWGVVTMICGFFAGNVAATAIEAINKIGSVFYGPILAMFLLAALGRWVRPAAVNVGVVAGVLVNLVLWLFFKNVFWFWWNAIGCVVTLLVGMGLSRLMGPAPAAASTTAAVAAPEPVAADDTPWPSVIVLLVWFAVIVTFCILLPRLI